MATSSLVPADWFIIILHFAHSETRYRQARELPFTLVLHGGYTKNSLGCRTVVQFVHEPFEQAA